MHYHVYRRSIGSSDRINNCSSSTQYQCTAVAVISSIIIIIIIIQMIPLLLLQNQRQQTGRMMHSSIFRIVHAWTAVPVKGRGQTSLYLNQYGTTNAIMHCNNNRNHKLCGICRLHGVNRSLNVENQRMSPQIIQQQYRSRSVVQSTPFDRKVTNRHRAPFRLFATNEMNIDNDDVTDDSDLYEYDDTDNDQWVVPKNIYIPEDRIGMKFVRSSGAGGQNVNKVSSCVQIRFHVLSADWMGPLEVRQRFLQQYRNTISKHDGVYHLESQAHRTQSDNRKDVMKKLEAAILLVWPRPKVRKLRVGLTERGKQKRKEEKVKQSSKKDGRRNQRFDF